MRWKDVNYLCHGIEAEVICEDHGTIPAVGEPVPLVRHHGVIECSAYDTVPSLYVNAGRRLVFDTAVVLLVPSNSRRRSSS